MDVIVNQKDYRSILYYAFLLVLWFFLSKPDVEYPMAFRISFLAAVFLPTIFRPLIYPYVLLCFTSINIASFCPILPIQEYYYLIFALPVLFSKTEKKSINRLLNIGIIAFYFIIDALIHFDYQEFVVWWIVAMICSAYIRDVSDIQKMILSFEVVSIFLSIIYLTHLSSFAYTFSIGLERSGWINANQFGGFIAVGFVLSVFYLIKSDYFGRDKWFLLLSLASIILGAVSIILNASRGASFSAIFCSLMFVLFSKSSNKVKIAIVLVLGVVLFLSFQYGLFNILESRIEYGEGDMVGGRFAIWAKKVPAFFSLPSISQILFGIGATECANIGVYYSTHNDFVTALVAYGVIGLIFFILLIAMPFRISPKTKKMDVAILLLFLILECFVLEPLFRGYVPFVMLYMFIVRYSQIEA